jgi:hypothetical protein
MSVGFDMKILTRHAGGTIKAIRARDLVGDLPTILGVNETGTPVYDTGIFYLVTTPTPLFDIKTVNEKHIVVTGKQGCFVVAEGGGFVSMKAASGLLPLQDNLVCVSPDVHVEKIRSINPLGYQQCVHIEVGKHSGFTLENGVVLYAEAAREPEKI